MITNFGQYLGLYLAEELNDKKHTGFYLKLAKQYDSDDLLSVLSMTKDICRRKPVKNKAALFTKLFFEYIKWLLLTFLIIDNIFKMALRKRAQENATPF